MQKKSWASLLLLFLCVSFPLRAAEVFLYEGHGVWDSGKDNLNEFLREYQYSYETKSPSDIRAGDLNSHAPQLLIMPGGESWVYLEELGDTGGAEIKQFVQQGGSYLGICAGAFYATSHRQGGAATGPYGIGLLQGTAVDGTALQHEGYIEGVMDFHWELGNPLVEGLGKKVKMLLYGGPTFSYSPEEAQAKQLEVLLRFAQDQKPAMIRFRYGKGQVFLAAPHFEIKKEAGEEPQHDLTWFFLKRVVDSLIQHL